MTRKLKKKRLLPKKNKRKWAWAIYLVDCCKCLNHKKLVDKLFILITKFRSMLETKLKININTNCGLLAHILKGNDDGRKY